MNNAIVYKRGGNNLKKTGKWKQNPNLPSTRGTARWEDVPRRLAELRAYVTRGCSRSNALMRARVSYTERTAWSLTVRPDSDFAFYIDFEGRFSRSKRVRKPHETHIYIYFWTDFSRDFSSTSLGLRLWVRRTRGEFTFSSHQIFKYIIEKTNINTSKCVKYLCEVLRFSNSLCSAEAICRQNVRWNQRILKL